jgi:hypothetical protein
VKDILFDRTHGNRIALSDLDRNHHLVLASGLDYELYLLDVPPVPHRELESLISFRLRTVHPGASGHTLFDYYPEGGWKANGKPGRGSESQRIRVYVMRKDVFALYRSAAEAGVLVTADILADAAEHHPADGGVDESSAGHRSHVVGIVFENHLEVFQYHDGRLVSGFKTDIPADGAPDESSDAFGSASSVELYAARGAEETCERVCSARFPNGPAIAVHPISELADREGRRPGRRTTRTFEPVESRRRRLSRPGRRAFLVGVPTAITVLIVLYAWNTLTGYEQRLSSARHTYETLSRTTAGAAHANREWRTAQAELEALEAHRPRDTYGFFNAVAAAAPPGTVIREIRLGPDEFTVDGETNEPFAFAERLAADSRFSNVRVVQAAPNPQAPAVRSERCTIAGSYHGR